MKHKVSFQIDKTQQDRLEEIAKKNFTSVSAIIRQAIADKLEKEDKK